VALLPFFFLVEKILNTGISLLLFRS
jgi:hypothetical protein